MLRAIRNELRHGRMVIVFSRYDRAAKAWEYLWTIPNSTDIGYRNVMLRAISEQWSPIRVFLPK
jgi:hypothetical protein